MSDLTVKLKLTADGKLLSSEVSRVEKQLNAMRNAGARAGKQIDASVSKTRRGVESISTQLSRAKTQLLAFFGASALKSFAQSVIQTGDSLTLLNARLQQATGTSERFAQAQQQIQAIARGARADYEATANLYSRLTVSAAEYNITQQQIADTTAAVTYGLKLYGASTQEAQSATLQLSQALASGKLQGDEFRSMAEAAPPLMRALADSLNVPIGALKEMASQGQLTTEVVINALSSQRDAMETAFTDMPVTVGEAVGQLVDNIKLKFSEWNDTSEFTKTLAEGILYLASNLDVLVSALEPAAYLLAGWAAYRYIPPLIIGIVTATRAWYASLMTLNISLATFTTRAGIASLATSGLSRALMLLGGPAGAFMLAAIAGYSLYKQLQDNTAASKLAARSAILEAEATDLAAYAADVATKESKELTVQLKKKAQAHLDNAKAALLDAQAEAKVRKGLLSKYKNNEKSFTTGSIKYTGKLTKKEYDSYVNTASKELKVAEDNVKRLIKVVDNAKGSLKTINDNSVNGVYKGLGNKATSLSSEINNLTSTSNKASQGVKTLSNDLKSATNAISAYKATTKELKDGLAAGLISQSDYKKGIEDAKNKLNATKGAAKLLKSELNAVGSAGGHAGKGGKKAAQGIETAQKAAEVAQKALADLTSKFQSLWEKLDPTVGASKEYADTQNIVNQAVLAGLITQAKANELLAIAKEKYIEASSALKKYSAIAALFPKKAKLDKVNKELSELNRLQKDPAALKQLNKTGAEIAKITQLYEGYKQAIKSGNPELIASFEKQIERLKKVGSETAKNAKTTKQVFQEALGKLDGVFKNIWTDLLNGSKNFGKALKDWFKNLLAEMAHAAITKPIVLSITGAFAGGTNAQGMVSQAVGQAGGGGGLFSSLGSLFKADGGIGKGITSLGDTLGIKFGDSFVTGATGAIGGAGIGGLLAGLTGGDSTTGALGGALGGLAGNLILPGLGGWIGGALGGVLGGLFGKKKSPESTYYTKVNSDEAYKIRARKLDQDKSSKPQKVIVDNIKTLSDKLGLTLSDELVAGFKIRQKSKKSKNLVAVLESFISNPSNRIYKTVKSAEELKDPKIFALEVARLSLATVANKNVTDFGSKTSAQRGLIDKLQTQESIESLDIKQVTAITTWLKNIETQARALEETSPQLTSVFEKIKGTATEYTAGADAILNVTKRFGNEALDNVLNYATSLNSAGDLLGTDLARISNAFIIVSETASQLNLTLPALGNGFVEAADGLVTAMGGVEQFAKVTANYYSKYFSKGEQQVKAYGKAHETLLRVQSDLGVSTITNAQNFRTYIESLDLTSQAGRDAYATAMQYVDAIYQADQALSVFKNAIANIESTLGGTMNKIQEDLMNPQELYDSRKLQAETLALQLKDLTNPAELQAKVKEINGIVNTMWGSLQDTQKKEMGSWFTSFLGNVQSIATNRVDEIANENGGSETLDTEYIDARAQWESASQQAQALATATQSQQQSAANLQAAVASMQASASSLSSAVASIPSKISVQANVSVKESEVGR